MWLVWEHNKYTHTSSFEVLSIDYADFSLVSSSHNLCLAISIFSLRTVSLVSSRRMHVSVDSLVWFCLVYLFFHSVTHVTLDTSITDYLFSRLYSVFTSSCTHLTIIIPSSSSYFCHYNLLSSIYFLTSVL